MCGNTMERLSEYGMSYAPLENSLVDLWGSRLVNSLMDLLGPKQTLKMID